MIYKNEKFNLTDDFIDVGFMGENIEVNNNDGESFEIKRSHPDKSMTLLVSVPNNEAFKNELAKLDYFMKDIQVPINCYMIFNQKPTFELSLEKFTLTIDSEEEFGNMYGTKIIDGCFEDDLTKALFLISKDGAIFYLDMPEDLEKLFDLERLQVELNKAYVSYTGVGCH